MVDKLTAGVRRSVPVGKGSSIEVGCQLEVKLPRDRPAVVNWGHGRESVPVARTR